MLLVACTCVINLYCRNTPRMDSFDLDDIPANRTQTQHFSNIVQNVQSRRGFLKTGLGLGAIGFFGLGLSACTSASRTGYAQAGLPAFNAGELKAFQGIASTTQDTISLPPGYAYAVINRWGDKLHAHSPEFKGDASDSGDAQAQQVGYNHDGMHFFPIDASDSQNGSSQEGLLVTNHEYITPHFFFPKGVEPGNALWNLDWVRKSQHAQGASVQHMRLNADGRWENVLDSRYNRSI